MALISEMAGVSALRQTFAREELFRDAHPVEFLTSWAELLRVVQVRQFQVVFVQPDFPSESPAVSRSLLYLERATYLAETTTVIPYVPSSSLTATLQRALRHMAFPFLMVGGIDDDPASILRILGRVRAFHALSELGAVPTQGEGRGSLGGLLPFLLGWPPTKGVDDFARKALVSPRTLQRRLADLLGRGPQEALRWARLMEAVALWELGVRPGARISYLLGMGGSSNLGRLSRELTGRPFSRLTDPEGGLVVLMNAFKTRAS